MFGIDCCDVWRCEARGSTVNGMSQTPVLIPLSPAGGEAIPVADSPFWIGQQAECAMRVHHPAVLNRHVALIEREDGFWVRPAPGAEAQLNGIALTEARVLADGDRLQLAPGLEFRFATSEGAATVAPVPGVQVEARREMAQPPPPRPSRHPSKRRRGRSPLIKVRGLAPWAVLGLVAFGAIWALQRGLEGPQPIAAPLSEEDAERFQELMVEASERMERATALLEMGLSEAALAEFARAVNSLETSHLGTNPWLRPRIAAVEAAVGEIYRSKRLAVPEGYANATSSLSMASLFRAEIEADEFSRRVDFTAGQFRDRFGKDFVVTGRDHAEHLALYGVNGALDIRTRDLEAEEIRFLIDTFRTLGIRVKDFSDDQVLAEQVRRAHAAGLSDRAGTGLHLHVDRFASRRDRYTVE